MARGSTTSEREKPNGSKPAPARPWLELKQLRQNPRIRLNGNVDDAMLARFLDELDTLLEQEGGPPSTLLLEVSTQGGNADYGERVAEEICLLRDHYGIDCLFLGNTFLYSAGVTMMSGFPVEKRFLTRNTTLLVHERRLDLQVHLIGSLRSVLPQAQDLLAQIEFGQAIQERGFTRLIHGSKLTLEELQNRTLCDWYVSAEEALELGLIACYF